MKKISTVAIEGIQIFKDDQLTIGLDLGDRTSHYCICLEVTELFVKVFPRLWHYLAQECLRHSAAD